MKNLLKLIMVVMLMLVVTNNNLFAEIITDKVIDIGGKKIIYSYKQFEKLDFEELSIEGDNSSVNELSIAPIHEKKYANKLPYRTNFTPELRRGIERVR